MPERPSRLPNTPRATVVHKPCLGCLGASAPFRNWAGKRDINCFPRFSTALSLERAHAEEQNKPLLQAGPVLHGPGSRSQLPLEAFLILGYFACGPRRAQELVPQSLHLKKNKKKKTASDTWFNGLVRVVTHARHLAEPARSHESEGPGGIPWACLGTHERGGGLIDGVALALHFKAYILTLRRTCWSDQNHSAGRLGEGCAQLGPALQVLAHLDDGPILSWSKPETRSILPT